MLAIYAKKMLYNTPLKRVLYRHSNKHRKGSTMSAMQNNPNNG